MLVITVLLIYLAYYSDEKFVYIYNIYAFTFVYICLLSKKKVIVVLLQNLVFEQEVTDSRIETTLEILQVTAEYFETNFSVICNYPLSKTIEYQLSIPEGGKISWSLLEIEKYRLILVFLFVYIDHEEQLSNTHICIQRFVDFLAKTTYSMWICNAKIERSLEMYLKNNAF